MLNKTIIVKKILRNDIQLVYFQKKKIELIKQNEVKKILRLQNNYGRQVSMKLYFCFKISVILSIYTLYIILAGLKFV